MDDPLRPEPRAGGALIAIALVAGAIAGVAFGQPTIGVLGGGGLGALAAAALWWRERV